LARIDAFQVARCVALQLDEIHQREIILVGKRERRIQEQAEQQAG